ncbi:hypothetical protein LXL04_034321 [Taraxacum kok-saghyz]
MANRTHREINVYPNSEPPLGVIEELEKNRRKFLWGGSAEKNKIHWVSWDKVIALKDLGGLGVDSIRALNIALLIKWRWRLKTKPNSLWAKVIVGAWNNIAGVKKDIKAMGFRFIDIFSQIVKNEKKKLCKVADRVTQGGINWKWKSNPITAGLINDLDAINSDIAPISLHPGADQISCIISDDGNYRVSVLRKLIESKAPDPNIPFKVNWCKLIPIKVTSFIWRAAMGRIPSVVALSQRGITIDTCACIYCIDGLEDAILVTCPPSPLMLRVLSFTGLE